MNPKASNQKSTRLPAYSWLGFLIIVGAQLGLILEVNWVATWLTPIMWSGYILLMDGLLYRRQGSSWLTTRKLEFPLLALLSIGIWVLFEAYNLHLQNWLYRGVPENPWVRGIAFGWSFATILPGIFITSELVLSNIPKEMPSIKNNLLAGLPDWLWSLIGASLVLIPLTLPIPIARFLFGAVWLGFIFLFDPINRKLGVTSLRDQWNRGNYRVTAALLLGGFLCGFLWEAWNYQAFRFAGGYWIYTVPEPLRIFNLHYGQMPILGMLGFPPFAIELYVIYHFLRSTLDVERLLGPFDW
jgi:hypothetical protein